MGEGPSSSSHGGTRPSASSVEGREVGEADTGTSRQGKASSSRVEGRWWWVRTRRVGNRQGRVAAAWDEVGGDAMRPRPRRRHRVWRDRRGG